MTEAGIGRILVASLHQGISDVLPMRLEFYENWLNPDGLRLGTIGLAPVKAVLSFLRQEGEPYRLITCRAGEYAAEWTVASQWPAHRAFIRSMPLRVRSRLVLGLAKRVIRGTAAGCRARVTVRDGHARLDITGSVFCNVRDAQRERLCGYYEATVSRLLALYDIGVRVEPGRCRAVGDPSCLVDVALERRRRPRHDGAVPSE
jgi:hypothetical protein